MAAATRMRLHNQPWPATPDDRTQNQAASASQADTSSADCRWEPRRLGAGSTIHDVKMRRDRLRTGRCRRESSSVQSTRAAEHRSKPALHGKCARRDREGIEWTALRYHHLRDRLQRASRRRSARDSWRLDRSVLGASKSRRAAQAPLHQDRSSGFFVPFQCARGSMPGASVIPPLPRPHSAPSGKRRRRLRRLASLRLIAAR